MVTNGEREGGSSPDRVQDLELLRVSRSSHGPVYDASRGRRLSLRAVLFHDNHVQNGPRKHEGCGVCRKGLEGALEAVTEAGARRGSDEVAKGGGADPEAPAASASGDRSGGKEGKVLWR